MAQLEACKDAWNGKTLWKIPTKEGYFLPPTVTPIALYAVRESFFDTKPAPVTGIVTGAGFC